jgi:hypothetical protein
MKWIMTIMILAIILIAGCIQEITKTNEENAEQLEKLTTNITETEETNLTSLCNENCTGSAGICKEYKCLEGTCIVITLSNCCGNGVCETNESYGVYTNCSEDCKTIVQEINHTSCAESGKIKVLVVGLVGSQPTYTDDTINAINEAKTNYPVELSITRVTFDSEGANNPTVKEYYVSGYPTVIINCHLRFTGNRNVDNFKALFNDLLETENK